MYLSVTQPNWHIDDEVSSVGTDGLRRPLLVAGGIAAFSWPSVSFVGVYRHATTAPC